MDYGGGHSLENWLGPGGAGMGFSPQILASNGSTPAQCTGRLTLLDQSQIIHQIVFHPIVIMNISNYIFATANY